jgi:hypothetical protein
LTTSGYEQRQLPHSLAQIATEGRGTSALGKARQTLIQTHLIDRSRDSEKGRVERKSLDDLKSNDASHQLRVASKLGNRKQRKKRNPGVHGECRGGGKEAKETSASARASAGARGEEG